MTSEITRTRVLVIDDSKPMRDSIVEMLNKSSLNPEVRTAENGAAGIKQVFNESFECVICDLEMPVMSGIEFLRHVRTRFNRLELPVLLLTSHDSTSIKIEGFKHGASDFLAKPCDSAELMARVETHVSLATMQRQLTTLANEDPLTRLLNRRAFMEAFDIEINRARRFGQNVGLILLDIDHFKKINDTYGHPAGDAVLLGLARLLKSAVRKYDVVARVGGEEFAIYLPSTTLESARVVAERIRSSVEAAKVGPLDAGQLTISLGLACGPKESEEVTQIYQRTDKLLYAAKEGGRNRVVAEPPGLRS